MEYYKSKELNLPNESWTPTDIKDIEVSNFGRVRTVSQFNSLGAGMIKTQRVNKSGQLYFTVLDSSKSKNPFEYITARVIYKTLIGDFKSSLSIAYKDGNKLNCCANNLYVTRKHKYKIEQKWNYYEITLLNGYKVLIDCVDYGRIQPVSFTIKIKKGEVKIQQVEVKSSTYKKKAPLHRLIYPNYAVIDHIDRNPLNNRKINLRECNLSQNAMNSRGTKTKFKGVYVGVGRIRSTIKAYGVKYNLGTFKSEEEAAVSYDYAARILHGEFAFLNFPNINDGSFIDEKYLKRINTYTLQEER